MTTDVKDFFKDVLAHTHDLGIYEMVKITGTDSQTQVETVDDQRTVILKGKVHKPVTEFVDQTLGLSRMGVLNGFLTLFRDDSDKVTVTTQERNGDSVPTEVRFERSDGTNADYRFMLAEVIEQQLKEIKFRGANFDVEINPTQKNYQDLAQINNILKDYEDTFSPRTENGKLYFYVGDSGGDRSKILIADNVKGNLNHDYAWPLGIVLKIMALGNKAEIVMSFTKNLMQIRIDTGIGEYTYLLPPKG